MSELILRAWRVADGAPVLLGVPDGDRTRWLLSAGDVLSEAALAKVREACGGTIDLCCGGPDDVADLEIAARWRGEGEPPASVGEARLTLTEPGTRRVVGPLLVAPADDAGTIRTARGPAGPPPGVDAGAFFDLLASRQQVVQSLAAEGSSPVLRVEWKSWRVLLPANGAWRVLLGARTWATADSTRRPGFNPEDPVELHLPG